MGTGRFVAGVAIVDIGGGNGPSPAAKAYLVDTCYSFAGENITNDIKTGLGVLKHRLAMKVQFGSALANEAKIKCLYHYPWFKRRRKRSV